MLAAKPVLPLNAAVIECDPGARLDVESCAEPLLRVAVPKPVEPSRNVTVPVAELPAPACTVAVNVTPCPAEAGFKLETSPVVVVAWFTVSFNAAEVLPAKFASPE